MTYEEFLEKLRQTPRDWHLSGGGSIRRNGNELAKGAQCPMLAIFPDTAETESLYRLIALSADCHGAGGDRRVRQELLEACGLQE